MGIIVTKLDPASQTNNSVDSPNNVLLSDNNFAVMNSSADWVKATGYTAPASGQIQQVLIGLEARKQTIGTTKVTVSYEISGVPTGSSKLVTIDQNEQDYTFDVTSDRTWTDADINNLTVRVDGTNVTGQKAIDIDHVFCKLVEDDLTGPLTGNGFRAFAINGTPMQIVDSTALTKWRAMIQNRDQNTDYLYISNTNSVSESNGWKIMPNEHLELVFNGSRDIWATCPTTQTIIVILQEI